MLNLQDISKKTSKDNSMIMNRLEASKKAHEVHRENIRKSLQHRLQVAKAKGDEKLIRQLEAEMKYFS
jgi:hypothetical protein